MAELGRPPLNLQPHGLLSSFGIKSGGRNPEDLVPQLQPTLELAQWYGETNAIDVTMTRADITGVANDWALYHFTASTPEQLPVDGTGIITVPNGEVWRIWDAAVQWIFTAVAGGNLAGPLMLCSSNGVGIRYMPCIVSGATTSSASFRTGGFGVLTRPTFLIPGDQLGVVSPALALGAAGALEIDGYLRLQRMRV